jgi:predicted dehydrogenase
MTPLTIVGVGCGDRTRIYCTLAARQPHRYRLVGAADPNPARLEQVRRLAGNPGFRAFADDAALFAAGRLADLCIIGTQDAYHVQPALRAMELGYDLLLEKPIAPEPRAVLAMLAAAERLGRKVLVCHVLRYAPFYVKIKEIIASGQLGEVVTLDAREGVGPWHQCHSFVRGHWAVAGAATPMIVAKCCHDLDIISWLMARPCLNVASRGALAHFTAANAPAGAPARCTDGCPAGATCPYNALLYAGRQRGWLPSVMDGGAEAGAEAVAAWLASSPWGRCAYRCDNDVVDHQVVQMEFQGGATATLTMTAFDHGRDLVVCGTRGTLRGGDTIKAHSGHDIIVQMHRGDTVRYGVADEVGGHQGHGGGDPGLVHALDQELARPAPEMRSGLHASVESHLIGFAAEEARRRCQVVELEAYRRSL